MIYGLYRTKKKLLRLAMINVPPIAFQKGLFETKKQPLLKFQGISKERNIVKKEFLKKRNIAKDVAITFNMGLCEKKGILNTNP